MGTRTLGSKALCDLVDGRHWTAIHTLMFSLLTVKIWMIIKSTSDRRHFCFGPVGGLQSLRKGAVEPAKHVRFILNSILGTRNNVNVSREQRKVQLTAEKSSIGILFIIIRTHIDSLHNPKSLTQHNIFSM